MGIDPATIEVGVGVLELKGEKVRLINGYHIHSKHDDIFDRYKEIYEGITEITKRYNPDVVGIEAQYFGRNVQTLAKLSFVAGVTWTSIYLNTDAKTELIYPVSWRKLALQDGGAKKKDVINHVTEMFGIKKKQYKEDTLEAIGIALAMANKELDKVI